MSLYDCALRSALHSAKPDTNLLNRQMENDLPPEALVFLTKMNIFFILLLIFLVIIDYIHRYTDEHGHQCGQRQQDCAVEQTACADRQINNWSDSLRVSRA